ncbi:MAG TPA: dipeptidase [Gemmatimonadaceae bacterium]
MLRLPLPQRLTLGLLAAATLALPARAQEAADAALVARARAIHERVITLDTHVDISPSNFTAERNYTQRLSTQVNLPNMVDGGLDAAFLIVYVGQRDDFTPEGYQRAYDSAIEKFDAIHRLTREIAPDRIGLALTPDDVRTIAASGRKVALIGVENAYPLGEDLGKIKEFYDRGGRYMSLAHNGHSQWSDSNTGEAQGWKWNGLSPLGRQAIAEMNRVGIMIDISHPSKASSMQAFELSKAPIIASHSAVRALCNHSRNMDDEQLRALQKNGGVIQVVAFASYVKCAPPEVLRARQEALQQLYTDFGLPTGRGGARGGRAGGGGGRGGRGALQAAIDSLPADRRAEFDRRMAAIDQQYPVPPRATVKDFVDHIDYAVKLIGIDHVGISSDFDGGGGVEGWSNASETFNVTLELVRRGYTEEQIAKIWSGNLLRVMGEVQRIAQELQRQTR